MTVPAPPPEHVEDYRRLWWRATRRDGAGTAALLATAAPGLAVGLWLTGSWASPWAAAWVAGLCGVGTMLAGQWGWRLVRRVVRGPRPPRPPPRLVRARTRGEVAMVTPPRHGAGSRPGSWAVAALDLGLVAALAVAGAHTGLLGPAEVGALAGLGLVSVAAGAGAVSSRLGPRVALFADRVEIRCGLGRYVVPWTAIFAAGERDERVVVYVKRPDQLVRKGWPDRQPRYGVRVGDPGVPATVVVEAIESHRRDTRARAPGPTSPR